MPREPFPSVPFGEFTVTRPFTGTKHHRSWYSRSLSYLTGLGNSSQTTVLSQYRELRTTMTIAEPRMTLFAHSSPSCASMS